MVSHLLQDNWVDFFKTWSECPLWQTCLQTDRQLDKGMDTQTDAGEIHLSKAPQVYTQKGLKWVRYKMTNIVWNDLGTI